MKKLLFTVTNDLVFDRRMSRICGSLAANGYAVTLVGTKKSGSPALTAQPYRQKRLQVFFKKGPGFYIEYNARLFFYLLFAKADGICAIDLDTILPVFFVSRLRGKKRIYDAHEYFSQMKEVITRPRIYRIWHRVEKTILPKFKNGYTVSESIATDLKKNYGVDYGVIRNLPLYEPRANVALAEKNILYQGAVNESRGFEFLIPAMKDVNAKLLVYGDGNFFEQAKALSAKYGMEERIHFFGMTAPAALKEITRKAYIGINLVENTGLSQYYSLANKFFDYIQAGVPQVTMNFPEYAAVNDKYRVAILLDDLQPETIASALNKLLDDAELHASLKANCVAAAKDLNWQNEEQKLISFYKNIFG